MSKALRLTLVLAISLALTLDAYAEVITRIRDRQMVTLSQLIDDAEHSDLIVIGEAHDIKIHHEMQLSLIRALAVKKFPLAIGLEMFQADSQQSLDEWTEGKIPEPEFEAIYARNWSIDWTLYRDIFIFARDNHIPMVALNIPKELATKVSRQGFASLTPEEKKGLPRGTNCDLNNLHTAFLKSSFQEVFKRATNGRIFTYFCEAQTLRNSGMAMNIKNYLKYHPDRKIVALAGIWHAVKNAIGEQLERDGSKLTNMVIINELQGLNSLNITPEIADYMIGW